MYIECTILYTVSSKIIRAFTIILAIFLSFECQFLSTRVTEEVTKSTKCDKEATSQKPVVKGQNIESVILEMPKRQGLDLKSCVGIRTIG